LLVIAWVGFDDNRDLNLEGSRSALPIWTEFMLKAYELYPARDSMSFKPPPGIEIVRIDAESLMLATPSCTNTFEEAFIAGTAPTAYCPIHSLEIAGDVDKPVDGKASDLNTPPIIRTKPTPLDSPSPDVNHR